MENTAVQNKQTQRLADILSMNNYLVVNAASGWENNNWENRPENATNHAAWVVGHMVSARHLIGMMAGLQSPEPHAEVFGQGKGYDPEVSYPSLETCLSDWNNIAAQSATAVANMPEAALAAEAPLATPMGKTVGDMIAFLTHHEAYHLGQLGILRKYHGMDSMSYKPA